MEEAHATSGRSLDERYLDFVRETEDVFAEFPLLEGLRYFIFRHLLVLRTRPNWQEIARHWARPFIHPQGRFKTPESADVVVFIEGLREVIIDAMVPVYQELTRRGVKVALVGAGGATNLSSSAWYLQSPTFVVSPSWATPTWDGLSSALKELGHSGLRGSYKRYCCNVEGLRVGLDRMLDRMDPKVVVVASTQLPAGATLVVRSRERKILTLLMQHGVLQPLYLPLIADHLLTWGISSCQSFADLGVPAEKLIPIGSPRHDRLVASKPHARSALLNIVGLSDRPTFVFFSSGNDLVRNGLAPQECASWLDRLASEYADRINVVVRLHPNEDGSLYQNCSHLHVIKDSPDLTTTLDGCDWVGSLCSTVMYDALLFHKPVWQFFGDGWPELADNWHRGLALRISSELDLISKVEKLLLERTFNHEEENVRRAFANQGRAAQAVATYITSILETPRLGCDNLSAADESVNCQTN